MCWIDEPTSSPFSLIGVRLEFSPSTGLGKLGTGSAPDTSHAYQTTGGKMGHTTQLQQHLELARRGVPEAWDQIIDYTCERLRLLTRKMLRGYPGVRRWSQTDDVLQNSMIRLHRPLAEVRPESPRQFYGLAATQIRRELIDLSRHYYGAEGVGARHHTDGGIAAEATSDGRFGPEDLESLTEFHQEVERLADEQREIVNLLWYEGLSQPEAAAVLGVSLATVKRRWQASRLALYQKLKTSWGE